MTEPLSPRGHCSDRGGDGCTRERAERLSRVLARVGSHSKAVRMIVESAEAWVDTDGKEGRRYGE